ncbi:MAG TPA: hypothetical protein PK890_08050 [Terrimesophilobacter sp.]|nr:hypothetical protein [Terrimesophilobacter sp.]
MLFLGFLTHQDSQSDRIPIYLAWLLHAVAFAVVVITIIIVGERMPHWLFAILLTAIAGVIALDFISIWRLGNIGTNASASIAASLALLLAMTMRRGIELVIAASTIILTFIVAIILTTPLTIEAIPAQVTTLVAVGAPPLFGCWLVARFRRMVQFELDRVLVQSTVSAPRLAVGMLASEELARLDLAAEALLDPVASERTPLPLEAKTASRAASLATELRLHLIEGRRETWLYHAVTESEQLGRAVSLNDPSSLAGLLDTSQRDGLLSAVWLLISDKGKTLPRLRLELGPIETGPQAESASALSLPITITTTDVTRNRIDPGTWHQLQRVGEVTSTTSDAALVITIESEVANPADQYHAEKTERP